MDVITRRPSPTCGPALAQHAVLWRRSQDLVQVGLPPSQVLLLPAEPWAGLLPRLDGRTTADELERQARDAGLPLRAFRRTLHDLGSAALLRTEPAPGAVRLVGAGVVARQLAELLIADACGATLELADDRAAARRGAGLREELARRHGPAAAARVRSIGHWTAATPGSARLTVLAGDRAETDRGMTEQLLRNDEPHLLVRVSRAAALVGPLVLPGRTSCVRCSDLIRRDADGAWPDLLRELHRPAPAPPTVLSAWAAATAAGQVLAYLGGAVPESAGATLELSATDHALACRPWPAHPACGCGWAPPTEWGS